jgi:Holliday junction resolvase-like predicted endonuclease
MKLIKEKSSSRKGDLAEYYAVTWLWDNGYEVFRNCGCDGFIDLVVRDPKGMVQLVDVKTAGIKRRKNKRAIWQSKSTRTPEQVEAGVRFLLFIPETRKLRWVNHRGK